VQAAGYELDASDFALRLTHDEALAEQTHRRTQTTQTLIVTQGRGWVQKWGHEVEEIHPGDIVWIPEGVKHWHGATSETAMTHIAIAESLNGSPVEWLEKVTDEQYPAKSA